MSKDTKDLSLCWNNAAKKTSDRKSGEMCPSLHMVECGPYTSVICFDNTNTENQNEVFFVFHTVM